jgi:hypothetical protein
MLVNQVLCQFTSNCFCDVYPFLKDLECKVLRPRSNGEALAFQPTTLATIDVVPGFWSVKFFVVIAGASGAFGRVPESGPAIGANVRKDIAINRPPALRIGNQSDTSNLTDRQYYKRCVAYLSRAAPDIGSS